MAKFALAYSDEKFVQTVSAQVPWSHNIAIIEATNSKEERISGKKLQNAVHVDHFIPWSFVKDDKIWNFVLACPTCNEKKNNRIPGMIFMDKIISRNRAIKQSQNEIIQTEFANYTDELIIRMRNYAKLCGLKEYLI